LNWVRTKDHQSSLYDLGEWVADHGIEAGGPNRAGRDLLFGLPPRVGQWLDEELCRPGESDLAAARRLALALDYTTLAIQGPPRFGQDIYRCTDDLLAPRRREASRHHWNQP
jgi:uncharacterized protein